MIKKIIVTNYLNETTELELINPFKSGFAIESIDGLGPTKADVNITDLSLMDGSVFNSSRVNYRNIVMKIILLDNPDIETSRQKLYNLFPIKKKVKVEIVADHRDVVIEGYVEKNDPDIFSKQEKVQISIVCPNPYFYSNGENSTIETVFSGVESNFEFPFGNESLDEKLLEMGLIINETSKNIKYDGDEEIGFNVYIHILGDVTNLSIYNITSNESMAIKSSIIEEITGSGLVEGDDIIITTIKGKKSITLLRNGVYINILNALDKNSSWIQLYKGDNVIVYTADYGATNLQFRIENNTIYEGI